ncbi:uncharacterized protein LOC129884478 isoform X2 [Solanum dulcamara]|uniref:uncharacterized protein LOC129884478 isoform X2 n=1 Tax=Solanum dulcamara TaxID=45834 RepID=UPI00248640BD|nr:uncharacterized protein LOC129884478 isoform X2 [Solanum dulcamara]
MFYFFKMERFRMWEIECARLEKRISILEKLGKERQEIWGDCKNIFIRNSRDDVNYSTTKEFLLSKLSEIKRKRNRAILVYIQLGRRNVPEADIQLNYVLLDPPRYINNWFIKALHLDCIYKGVKMIFPMTFPSLREKPQMKMTFYTIMSAKAKAKDSDKHIRIRVEFDTSGSTSGDEETSEFSKENSGNNKDGNRR